jgi:lipopolysaccharide export system protein LptA
MPRLIRFITSFVTVLGAYWLYALLAVPLIEPAAAGPQQGSVRDRRGAAGRINDRLGELQELVPAEARAQLKTPLIIESDDFRLLLQKYKPQGDGRVTIEPCVLIYSPGASNEDAELKPPIVLYAPAGAVMVFDQPIDLTSGKIVGRPTSGRLLGEITITSPGESDGPEDDLRIVTRDVQVTPERISTPNAVRFEYGASSGSGRNMVIKLQQGEKRPGSTGEPPKVQGIESFELLELDKLHLEPPGKSDSNVAVKDDGQFSGLDTQRPLEITCQGPFLFDPIRQYAKFEDRVDVMQLNPVGEADQLNCEVLTLYFSRSRNRLSSLDGGEAKRNLLGSENAELQLREIEATGNPVIVRVLSRDAEARGQRLSYDVQRKRVVLEGDNGVWLRHGPNRIDARSIDYTSKGKGRLGEIHSQGPGKLHGELPDAPGREFTVEWGGQLQLEPYEDQHLAILNGGVRLEYLGEGTLNAERIDFWLSELPTGPEPDKLKVIPDRMLVQDQVKINSREAFGNVDLLKIWFDVVDDTVPLDSAGGVSDVGSPPPTSEPTGGALAAAFDRREPSKPVERRFHVRGDVAQASVLVRNDRAHLTKLMLEGAVQLDEIPVVPSNEKPMHLRGDRITVSDAHDMTQTEISVIGRLATFQGRGMALTGTNINVDAKSNRLWIDGSGKMELPVDRGLKAEPLPHPELLTLTWQKEMNFDGRKVQFEEKVVAQTQGRQLKTEHLEVDFTRKVVFHDLQPKSQSEIKVEQLVCRGDVFMEGRTYERVASSLSAGGLMHRVSIGNGTDLPAHLLPSWEQFRASELTVNNTTGDLFARGPGHITTIRLKPKDLFDARLGRSGRAQEPETSDNQLSYLHVQFRAMMTGNMEQELATFHDVTHCIYDEVGSWQTRLDIHNPDLLSKKGMSLKAGRLTVARAPAPAASAPIDRTGSYRECDCRERTFTARGNRITYSEAKDWLILEGNGYAPAELTFQEYIGASPKTIFRQARSISGRRRRKSRSTTVRAADGRVAAAVAFLGGDDSRSSRKAFPRLRKGFSDAPPPRMAVCAIWDRRLEECVECLIASRDRNSAVLAGRRRHRNERLPIWRPRWWRGVSR